MNELTETQKAYLAGFFDGEGCISLSKFQGKNNKTPVYQLQVVIAQKTELNSLCEMVGVGSVHDNNHRFGRVYQQWRMSPKDSVEFLKAILPYLKIKEKEARLAIEFQERQGRKGSTGKGYMVPQELIDEKEWFYQELRRLKGESGGRGHKRGVPKYVAQV